jgi:hypothetical protein
MPHQKFYFVCKLDGGKWLIGVTHNESGMLSTIGQWYVYKQHVWLQDHAFLEVTEKLSSFNDDSYEQELDKLVIKYMKQYGAENVRYANTDTIPEHYRTLYPAPNPNMKYR